MEIDLPSHSFTARGDVSNCVARDGAGHEDTLYSLTHFSAQHRSPLSRVKTWITVLNLRALP